MTLTERLLFVLNANVIRLAKIVARTDDSNKAVVDKMADELKEAARAHRED